MTEAWRQASGVREAEAVERQRKNRSSFPAVNGVRSSGENG